MARAKTYTVAEILAELVDDAPDAARAVAAKFGPPPPIYTETGLRMARQIEADAEIKPDFRNQRLVIPVMCEFIDVPKIRTLYLRWLDERIEDVGKNGIINLAELAKGAASEPVQRQKRGPITDPEVLERRNAALVKARAERAKRLAAQREAAIDAATPEDAESERQPVEVG